MASPTERDWLRRHWGWIAIALVILCALQLLAMRMSPPSPWSWDDLAFPFAAAVVPNLIAGIVAGVVVHFLGMENNTTQYVRAMRSMRDAVANQRASGMKPEDVQTLMRRIVPEVSNLYFLSPAPPKLPKKTLSKDAKEHDCGTCGRRTPVDLEGRCGLCKDTLDSWRAEVPSV